MLHSASLRPSIFVINIGDNLEMLSGFSRNIYLKINKWNGKL